MLLTKGSGEDEFRAVDGLGEEARNEANDLAVEVGAGAENRLVADEVVVEKAEKELAPPNPENPLNFGGSVAPA